MTTTPRKTTAAIMAETAAKTKRIHELRREGCTVTEIAAFQASAPPAARKPRAKSTRPEDKLHVAVAKLLSAAIASPGQLSYAGACWFSLEYRAKRSLREGAANKQRGIVSGVPDIAIFYAGRVYFIELKAEKGVVSSNQKELHRVLAKTKVPVLIARSLESIAAVLVEWQIPHRTVSL